MRLPDAPTRRSRALARGLTVAALGGSAALWLGFLPDLNIIAVNPWMLAGIAPILVGGLIADRRPENPIGWLLLVYFGLNSLIGSAGIGVALGLLDRGSVTAAAIVSGIFQAVATPIVFVLAAILLLFPTGTIPGPRWRWAWVPVGIGSVFGATLGFLTGCWGGESDDCVGAGLLPVEAVADILPLFFAFIPVSVVLGLGALVLRWRRGDRETRQQLRWLLAATALLVIALLGVSPSDAEAQVEIYLLIVLLSAVPAAIGVAVLRYRLYDIDVVIDRTVVFLGLAGFITAVYATIVAGVGSLIGRERGIVLPLFATALVAIAFEPVRRRVHRVAARIAYGARAEPYEVLSALATHDDGDATPIARVARLVTDGLGADGCEVWLPRDEAWIRAIGGGEVAASVDDIEADHVALLHHDGEPVGALALHLPRGRSLRPADHALLADLSPGAALVAVNAQLDDRLRARAEDLRRSRRRLLRAHDEHRRVLERDLHDGAQQEVVALAVKLGLARTLAVRAGADGLAADLAALGDRTQRVVDGMRTLARGIYPPLLEAEGLAAAVSSAAGHLGVVADVTAPDDRFDRTTESTLYFCALEVLRRAARITPPPATTFAVRLADDDLRFEVRLAGEDALRGDRMADLQDRVRALDGALRLVPDPHGDWIDGRLPRAAGVLVVPDEVDERSPV